MHVGHLIFVAAQTVVRLQPTNAILGGKTQYPTQHHTEPKSLASLAAALQHSCTLYSSNLRFKLVTLQCLARHSFHCRCKFVILLLRFLLGLLLLRHYCFSYFSSFHALLKL